MYMSELILDYIEHLEVEGGRSSKTAENYRLYLERFVEFTEDIKVGDITSETIRNTAFGSTATKIIMTMSSRLSPKPIT
jgi:site-specific recombinase XerD